MTLISEKSSHETFILYCRDSQDISPFPFHFTCLFHLFTSYLYFFLSRLFSSHPLLQIPFWPQRLQMTSAISICPTHKSFFPRAGTSFEVITFFFSSSLPLLLYTNVKKCRVTGHTLNVPPLETPVWCGVHIKGLRFQSQPCHSLAK